MYHKKESTKATELQTYAQQLAAGAVTAEELRRERDVILDLYKHHLKLLLEANVFVYAVTGALLSFVTTHSGIPHVRWVLLFPIVFDSAFAFFFWATGDGIDYNEKELKIIAGGLGLNIYQKLDALKLGLKVSSVALAIVAILVGIAIFVL